MKKILIPITAILFLLINGYCQEEAAPDPLQENLVKLTDKDPSVRRSAAEALGGLKNPAAIQPLIQTLKDESPMVRSEAVNSLGLLRANDAAKPVADLLINDTNPDVRQQSAISLRFLGVVNDDVTNALKTAYNDKSLGIRLAAIQTTGLLRASKLGPDLVNLLTDKDSWVRREAANAIGEIGYADAVPQLQTLLNDEDLRVRIYTALALARLGKDYGKQIAYDALKNDDALIRIDGIRIITQLGDREAIPALQKLLNDKSPHVKDAAKTTLERFGVKVEEKEEKAKKKK